MSEIKFKVSLSPRNSLNLLKENEYAELVHYEIKNVNDEHSFGVLIFEKYFMRAGNKAALVIIADDVSGVTEIRAIATASTRDPLLNVDYGVADDFAASVEEILKEYIISD